ncbi:MAG: hypothetical protein AAGD00_10860 [Planctomycetota bacterium]
MHDLSDAHAEKLNAYLDGEMDGREREAFEALAASDVAVREALDAARRVEAGVRTEFEQAPPIDFDAVLDRVEPRGARTTWRAIGLAACLALVATVFVAINLPRDARLRADTAYAAVTASFVPEVICDTREKFEAYTLAHLGEGICPIEDPEIRMIGWKGLAVEAASGYEGRAKVLLAEGPQRERIVVLFLPESVGEPVPPRGGGLRMFERSFDGVRAWELTPFDEARVVGLLESCGPAEEPR